MAYLLWKHNKQTWVSHLKLFRTKFGTDWQNVFILYLEINFFIGVSGQVPELKIAFFKIFKSKIYSSRGVFRTQ